MKINRREFLKALANTVIGGCVATTGSYVYARTEAERLVVERVQIPLKGLKPALEGFKIVHMSDFHLYPFTQLDHVQRAVALANRLKPDVAVLTGDYIYHDVEAIFDLAPALAGLDARYGVFAGIGNHDIWTNIDVVKAGFAEARLPILQNQGIPLGVGREVIYLAGLDDSWSGQPDLEATLAGRQGDAPVILLSHEPDVADTFALDGRVSLQLSGHSHGGQIRLPGVGALVLPHLGRKYDQGLYGVNDMWVYTTRGIGATMVPTRFNCPPEITEITLGPPPNN